MERDERTDEQLLTAIAAGPGALPEFYRRHVGRVIAAGAKRFDRPEDVADFTADVFLAILESAGSFDPKRGSAVAWLYGVVNHVGLAEFRRRGRASETERRIGGAELLADDDIERLESRIDASADARAIYRALEALPEGDRRLLRLVAVDGLSPAQAAASLGISRIAARVRLHRSRKRLRGLLTDPTSTSCRPNRTVWSVGATKERNP